jgi:hypothetical protein
MEVLVCFVLRFGRTLHTIAEVWGGDRKDKKLIWEKGERRKRDRGMGEQSRGSFFNVKKRKKGRGSRMPVG